MKLPEITAAMQEYANARNVQGAATMQGWYNNRNAFAYNRDNNNQPIPPATEAYIHVYPGIVSNTLVFFVISAYKDVSTNSNILNDIQICQTTWISPSSSAASGADDLVMAQNWINNYSTWIGNNISTIFQGFRVPQSDSAYGTIHNAMMALKSDSGAVGVDADLVVQDIDGQTIEYFDTSLPVPPWGTEAPESDFYLYTLLT